MESRGKCGSDLCPPPTLGHLAGGGQTTVMTMPFSYWWCLPRKDDRYDDYRREMHLTELGRIRNITLANTGFVTALSILKVTICLA